jgi:hypothetical protein
MTARKEAARGNFRRQLIWRQQRRNLEGGPGRSASVHPFLSATRSSASIAIELRSVAGKLEGVDRHVKWNPPAFRQPRAAIDTAADPARS